MRTCVWAFVYFLFVNFCVVACVDIQVFLQLPFTLLYFCSLVVMIFGHESVKMSGLLQRDRDNADMHTYADLMPAAAAWHCCVYMAIDVLHSYTQCEMLMSSM